MARARRTAAGPSVPGVSNRVREHQTTSRSGANPTPAASGPPAGGCSGRPANPKAAHIFHRAGLATSTR